MALQGDWTSVRMRKKSARALSETARLSDVPVADVGDRLVQAVGGPEQAAHLVMLWRLAASRPDDTAAETALATARLAAIGRAMK